MSNSSECTIPEDQLFTREFVLKAVTRALVNVSKDLYNLGIDDLSAIALTMGDACLNHIDSRKDDLVYPREPNQAPVQPKKEGLSVQEESCRCSCGDKEVETTVCNGHQNPGESVCNGHQNTSQNKSVSSIESEVTEIVAKIRAEQSKDS